MAQRTASEQETEMIPPGEIKCFITGKLRKQTDEEKVRQDMAKSLVEEYGYDKKDVEIEFTIQMGRAKKRADIVVFYDGKKHTQENIYIIVEAKAEQVNPSNKKEGIGQLESYMSASPNCEFGVWIGNEKIVFKKFDVDGNKILRKIPDIPQKGEIAYKQPTRNSLSPSVNLKRVFKRIHNYIYANQGIQKDKAFRELLKIIFTKVYDENFSPTLKFYVLPDEHIVEVKPRIEDVFNKVQKAYPHIFKGNETIELKDDVLKYIVSELQNISLVNTDIDVKGEAYEEIVGPNLRGDRGEFFTPRNVCQMTIEMLFSFFQNELTTPGSIKILDPAVGTGGFLIAGIRDIKRKFMEREIRDEKLRENIREVVNHNFYGIDFNPFLTEVAQMNMVMHGDGSSNMLHADSLENPKEWKTDVREKIKFGEFDIVVTNPPFGANVPINKSDVLEQYELTTFDASNPRKSLPPEMLFIERCWDFLKPGGYMGIVLPDSILSNPGKEWIRKWILNKTYVIASIDLPVETFEPHTGTQTSVLILKKKTKEQQKIDEDYEVFMAIPEKIGHDRRGNPIFKKSPEGKIAVTENGEQIIDDHLPIITEKFKKWMNEKGMA
jgi:type I restriction enzyme M protein